MIFEKAECLCSVMYNILFIGFTRHARHAQCLSAIERKGFRWNRCNVIIVQQQLQFQFFYDDFLTMTVHQRTIIANMFKSKIRFDCVGCALLYLLGAATQLLRTRCMSEFASCQLDLGSAAKPRHCSFWKQISSVLRECYTGDEPCPAAANSGKSFVKIHCTQGFCFFCLSMCNTSGK